MTHPRGVGTDTTETKDTRVKGLNLDLKDE